MHVEKSAKFPIYNIDIFNDKVRLKGQAKVMQIFSKNLLKFSI
jgi:hypothetical protein